jgi:putative membrane protein
MAEPNDPRVYFAAERTILAWTRTALSSMGFGFVVAKFGVYLRMLANHPIEPTRLFAATVIGVAFVILGVLAAGVSAWQHYAFIRTLQPHELPAKYWLRFSVNVSIALAVLGCMLTVHLIVWMNDV